MHVERILALADFIEDLPHGIAPDSETLYFRMVSFRHSCGTPACIAGYAVYQGIVEGVICKDTPDYYVGDCAREYLNLTTESFDLFYGQDVHLGKITPKAAAWCLRNLTKTGRVAWAKAMKETQNV